MIKTCSQCNHFKTIMESMGTGKCNYPIKLIKVPDFHEVVPPVWILGSYASCDFYESANEPID